MTQGKVCRVKITKIMNKKGIYFFQENAKEFAFHFIEQEDIGGTTSFTEMIISYAEHL